MRINPFKIVWTTLIEDVVYILPTGPDFKQKYNLIVKPLDVNEPGAELSEKLVGYYIKDFIGSIFRITAINVDGDPTRIEVEDEELKNAGPQIGQYGWVYESIGDGTSRGIAPIRHKRIDESALDYSRAIELELLWRLRFTTGGVYIKPTFTDNLNGTFTIGDDGEYVLFRDTINNPPEKYSIVGGTFTPTDQNNSYLVAEFNGGEPRVSLLNSRDTINQIDVIPIETIYRNGTKLIRLDWDLFSVALANKLNDRLVRTHRFEAEENQLTLSAEAGFGVVVASGYVWGGASRWYLPEFHSLTNTIVYYRHVAGVWTESDVTTYNNSLYDNGTTTLPIGTNRYAVSYIYRRVGSTNYKAYMTIGQGDYTLPEAQAAAIPAPPPEIQSTGIYVGRIIIKLGDTVPTLITSGESGGGGGGVTTGVTSVSVVTSNGFSGTVDAVANPYIPAITLSTTVASGSILKSLSGSLAAAVAGDFPILNQSTTGNAATATKLQTGRYINGVYFDGTSDITVSASYTETDPVFTAWRDASRTAKYVWAAPNAANGAPTWRQLVYSDISGTAYTHPAYTPVSQTLSGATVLASFSSDAIGSVTGFTTRSLTLANLGFTGATNADYYNYWQLGSNSNSVLTNITSTAYACFNAGAGISISQAGATITITNTGGGGSGVTSVSAGNGMDFVTITTTGAVTLGTPSSCSPSTSNAVSATSHTHAITGVEPSLPSVGGNGYVLSSTIAGVRSWIPMSGGSGSPAGNDTEIQYNNAGSFGASSKLSFNGTSVFVQNVGGTSYTAYGPAGLLATEGTTMLSMIVSSGVGYISTNSGYTLSLTATSGISFAGNMSGSTYTVTAGDFILSSDERYKTEIQWYIPEYMDVEYKSYKFKEGSGITQYGVIAQEIEDKYPELVHTDKNGMKSVSYMGLLIREVAYLKEEVRKLKAKM